MVPAHPACCLLSLSVIIGLEAGVKDPEADTVNSAMTTQLICDHREYNA